MKYNTKEEHNLVLTHTHVVMNVVKGVKILNCGFLTVNSMKNKQIQNSRILMLEKSDTLYMRVWESALMPQGRKK